MIGCPTFFVLISNFTSAGVRTGLPSTATITSVGSSFPTAGSPPMMSVTSAPVFWVFTLSPAARSATLAAICCDCFISRRSTACRCPPLTPGATTADGLSRSAPLWSPPKSFSSRVALRTITSTK